MRHAWILVPLLLTGCGAQVPLWSKDYAAAETTRSYPGVAPAKVMAAAAEVVKLAGEPRDVQVKTEGGSLRMDRYFNGFIGMNSVIIDYKFNATVAASGNGSTVTLDMGTDTQDFASTDNVVRMPSPLVDTPHIQVADPYKLFFARMDYLLGKRPDWVTCSEAPAKLGASVALDPLCAHARDAVPAAPR